MGRAVQELGLAARDLAQVRAKLAHHADGDRRFVKVRVAVSTHGLAAVEAACAEAPETGLAAGDVILAVLAWQRQPISLPRITTPDVLRLKIKSVADRIPPKYRFEHRKHLAKIRLLSVPVRPTA